MSRQPRRGKRWRPPVPARTETRSAAALLRNPPPVEQAPEGTTAVLVVGFSRTWCGHCGLGAHSHEVSHQAVAGYGPERAGCGAVFTAITCDRARLDDEWRMALTEMRRDLPILDPFEALAVRRR